MMKTVYKATLMATATMLFCGLVAAENGQLRPGARHALGTASPMATTVMPAVNAPAARGFDLTATPRLPVLMLTQSYGDSAREMFAGGAVGYTLQNFPFQSTKTIVYLDVDTFNPRSRLNREALALAKEAGWPVVIESNTWNAKRVAEVAGLLFPEAARIKTSNTAVIVEAGSEGWTVRDTWPSHVAMKAGIPFGQTTEGALRMEEKATGTNPIHWSVKFAKEAYSSSPRDIVDGGKTWRISIKRDIVKTWVYWHEELGPQCIVAFKGTDEPEDWETNLANQFRTSVFVPSVPARWQRNNWKIGRGYATRLANMGFDYPLQCSEVYVTGHSLGGAMAQAYAMRELMQHHDSLFTPENIRGVYSYNPSRLGTMAASQVFVDLMRSPTDQWGSRYNRYDARQLRSYCRSGDPVWRLPLGFVQGTHAYVPDATQCTHRGANRGGTIKYNHSIDRWFEVD